MGPDNVATLGNLSRLNQVCFADFFIPCRCKPGNHQIAFFVKEEEVLRGFMLNQECIGPASLSTCFSSLEGFPDTFSRSCFQSSQLAMTADAIDMLIHDERRGHDGM